MRVRKASIARNPTESRNAEIAAAGTPGAARNVPRGTIFMRAGNAIARPTAIGASDHQVAAASAVKTNPAPTISCSGQRTGSDCAGRSGDSGPSAGMMRIQPTTISGSGAA